MTMTTNKIRKNDHAIDMIRERKPFTNGNGSLSGRIVSVDHSGVHCGDLPPNDRETLLAQVDLVGTLYVIYSYDTPIAWVPIASDTTPTMPRVRYSLTTTGHQYLAANALGIEWRSWETKPRHTGRGHTPYSTRKGW